MITKEILDNLKRRVNSVGRTFASGNCTVGNPTMITTRNTSRYTKKLSYTSKAKNRNIK